MKNGDYEYIYITTYKRKGCYLDIDTIDHNPYGPDETAQDGYKTYYINDLYHNIYGPAIIYPDGKKQYYLDGIHYTKKEWENRRHDY